MTRANKTASATVLESEWTARLDWLSYMVELRGFDWAGFKHYQPNRRMRIAISLILDRPEWLRADRVRSPNAISKLLCIDVQRAVIGLHQRRASELEAFRPVFDHFEVPSSAWPGIIRTLTFAYASGEESRRLIEMRSKDFKSRQKRELRALGELIRCLHDKNATLHFSEACQQHGIDPFQLVAATNFIKFWQRHEMAQADKLVQQSKSSGSRGPVPQVGRTEAVHFLASAWKSWGRSPSTAWSDARGGDRQTAFVEFVEACFRSGSFNGWIKATGIGSTINADLQSWMGEAQFMPIEFGAAIELDT